MELWYILPEMEILVFDVVNDAYWWLFCTDKYFNYKGTPETVKLQKPWLCCVDMLVIVDSGGTTVIHMQAGNNHLSMPFCGVLKWSIEMFYL